MASTIVLEGFALIAMAIIAGLVDAWAGMRYGQTEKRYLIGGGTALVGAGLILLYQFLMHRGHFLVGYYLLVEFAMQWILRSKARRNDG